jgi:Tfp pilus assembly protein PilP
VETVITEKQIKDLVDRHIMQCTIDYSGALRLGPKFDAATLAEGAVVKDLALGVVRYLGGNADRIVRHDDKGRVMARAVVLTEEAFWSLINTMLEMAKNTALELMDEKEDGD